MSKNCRWSDGSYSLRNAVRVIAILDLAFVAIPLIFETVNVGYLLGIVDPHGNLELDCAPIPDPKNSSNENDSSTESPNNPLCSWTYSIYKELSQGSWASKNVQAQIQTYTVMSLILFILIGGIIEGYLFGLLRRAVREEVHYWCKKWCWTRLFLLIFISVFSITKIYRSHYDIIDGIYDLTKVYRILTLLIVKCYMWELEKTVGVVYIQPLREPKQGSLGQDVHLLD